VGNGSIGVHNHASAAQGHLTFFVDRLDRDEALGMADGSESKTDRAFIVRNPGSRCRTLDAPGVKALRRWGLKFDLRKIQAGRAWPAFAGQSANCDLCSFVIVDAEVSVLQVALTRALDPNLRCEFVAGHNS